MDRKIKSPFAPWAWMPQRLLRAATARWRQWGKTEKGALGQDRTHAEVCTHRHGAHVAYETTRVVVGLGDPVTWGLASTGRRDGRWVGRAFQMAQDHTHHLTLRDDGDEPQRPLMAPRAGSHLQAKDPPQEPGPGPIGGAPRRLLRVHPLLAWCGDDTAAEVAVRRQTAAIAHQRHVRQGHEGRQLLQEFQR